MRVGFDILTIHGAPAHLDALLHDRGLAGSGSAVRTVSRTGLMHLLAARGREHDARRLGTAPCTDVVVVHEGGAVDVVFAHAWDAAGAPR